ncbi:MAG: succinate dehydrogenase/fumarate reductase iron-sulfur subunit [Eubacterium sp.]|nr:succinate dehydrogenase/fumarate reductase iron-sulfur subunit [Eubacterium sp.]
MKVKILRQQSPVSEPYWQTFSYTGSRDKSVAAMLDDLNYNDDLIDIDGNRTDVISWESSCLQGMCGACAMVICGHPALACQTFLRDLPKEEITLEPLRKFPTISDLLVDRSIIFENLKRANAYIEAYQPTDAKEHEHQYLAARCLKCGLCLEICPNYSEGQKFYGAEFANDAYLIASRSAEHKEAIQKEYEEHFAGGCSKSLACEDICPMKIPTLASMAKLNRRKKF